MSKFEKHERGDRVKWIIIFTVVAALIVGFFAIVTKGFKQNDPRKWFGGEHITASAQSGVVNKTSNIKQASSDVYSSDIMVGFELTKYTENELQYISFPDIPSAVVDDICLLSTVENRRWLTSGRTLFVLKAGLNVKYKVSNSYLSDHNWKNISVEDLLYNGMDYKQGAKFSAGTYKFVYTLNFEFSEGATFLQKDFDFSIGGDVTYSGDGVPLPETPSKTGYTFVGWYYDEEFTRPYDNQKITADTQLYAKFEAITYSITYNVNGGTVDGSTSYNIETETYTLPTPIRTGYDFLGWYSSADFTGDSVTEIAHGSTGNVTVYAKWEIQVYKVSFYVDGELYFEMDVEYGTCLRSLYIVNTQTLEAVAFSLDAEMLTVYSPDSLITNDMSLFASEKFAVYAGLTYNIDGVETMDLLDYNSTLSDLRVPEKDGYTFDGWYYDAEYTKAVSSTDKLTSNKTIYAKFTALPQTNFWTKLGAFFRQWWWAFVAGGAVIILAVTVTVIERKRKR